MKVWGCKDVGFGIWEWEGFGVSPVSEKGFRDLGFREREREREREEKKKKKKGISRQPTLSPPPKGLRRKWDTELRKRHGPV